MRYVRQVCCQFEQTREHVSANQREKLVVTGCPIRSDLRHLPPREEAAAPARARPAAANARRHRRIAGGQDGERGGDLELLRTFKPQGWQILHLAGRDHGGGGARGYRELAVHGRAVIDFTPAMADVWAVADLAVSRSGAAVAPS